jgi:hypothetical protein
MLFSHIDFSKSARPFDPQIDQIQKEIKRQEATVAALSAEGHEVTDATRQLNRLIGKRDALLQIR